MKMTAKQYGAHAAASEDVIQRHIITYLTTALPGAVIHHSPNQVQRSGRAARIEVIKKKAMGMLPGFPDLSILWRGLPAYIEVKRPGEYPAKTQRDLHEDLIREGAALVMVCRGVDDAAEFAAKMKQLLVSETGLQRRVWGA